MFGSARNSPEQVLTVHLNIGFEALVSVHLRSPSPFCPSVLFPSLRVFLSRSHIHTSIQFSHRPDFDNSIFYVFKCTTFCCYSALNNAVCWKSMRRSDSLSGEARVLFWFLNGFGGIGVLFCVRFCSIPHMWSKRLLSELLPRLSLPSSLSPACTPRLNFFFLKFSPLADLGLFSVQISIHSNTQNFSQRHKQPLPFATSNVFFNQCH